MVDPGFLALFETPFFLVFGFELFSVLPGGCPKKQSELFSAAFRPFKCPLHRRELVGFVACFSSLLRRFVVSFSLCFVGARPGKRLSFSRIFALLLAEM